MAEAPLADLIPLWRTLRERDTTILVTPAMDYLGCFELGGFDIRFVSDAVVDGAGEALRRWVGQLEDSMNLQFIFRVYEGNDAEIRAYEDNARDAAPEALAEYARGRAAFLREQPVRRSRTFLFFSDSQQGSPLQRGRLGVRMMFRPPGQLTDALHQQRVEAVSALRDKLKGQLDQLGIGARELSLNEVRQLHYELLNPTQSRRVPKAPEVLLRDNLWSAQYMTQAGGHLAEYTEAEQLCFEDVEDGRGHFRQGSRYRRVLTLKTLPENGTDCFMGRALQLLQRKTASGGTQPMPYTLAVNVDVLNQPFTRWKLDTQHRLVDALKKSLPFLQSNSAAKDVEDAAKQTSITHLFQELTEMATKVVSVSVSLLLDADSQKDLEAQQAIASDAFGSAGNSTFIVEEVSQLPAFLSMLPGAGRYQLRKKGCTSRNAADFLPVVKSWGGGRVNSLVMTPEGEFFRFALFDTSLGVNASHGLVVADTGSGKSFALALLVLDALLSGIEVILVDNGRSWQLLTQLMGGLHIPVNQKTSISPFMPYGLVLTGAGELDNDEMIQVVQFLEVCLTDHSLPAFTAEMKHLVSTAVKRCYRERFSAKPKVAPLMGDFRDYLRVVGDENPADKELAGQLVNRLRMFCEEDGLYAQFLNRPSELRFDSRLLTFEMEGVGKDPTTKKIALATLMEAISARAAAKRTRTIVVLDEAHEYLGGAADAKPMERFIGGAYAKMRKYNVAMWAISQQFETFRQSSVSHQIIGNSSIKLFLKHDDEKRAGVVAEAFSLSRRAQGEFVNLQKRPGHYSDAMLMYGSRMATMRLQPHPLAYWMLTTDPEDKKVRERAAELNPHLPLLELLQELAERYPHGWAHARSVAAGKPQAA